MRLSYRQLADRYLRRGKQIERLITERDAARRDASACACALEQVAGELSRAKDEIALHIVAAKHPSSALSDAHSMGVALQEALEARGVDLRLELARLEGGDL